MQIPYLNSVIVESKCTMRRINNGRDAPSRGRLTSVGRCRPLAPSASLPLAHVLQDLDIDKGHVVVALDDSNACHVGYPGTIARPIDQ